MTLFFSPLAFAESGVYVVPWISVEEVYDDNIFFDSEDETADFFTRVSPQLDVGYEAQTLTWLLSFRNDAEWYSDLSDLDSTTARQFGVGTVEYDVNRRWTLRGDTEYTKTNSAEDLSLTPGGVIPGLVGREEAERLLFAGGASYRFTSRLSGDLDYTWIDDDLVGASENNTQIATTTLEQALTPTRSLLYGYEYRRYEFTQQVGIDPFDLSTNTQSSNTGWVGLKQALSETSDLELRAGPRFSEGDVDPYFYLNWQNNYARGYTSVDARWDETVLLGEVGKVETRSVEGSWSHEFTSKLAVRGSAGYAYLEGTDYTLDILSFELSGNYQISPAISLTARWGFNAQQDDRNELPSERVTHNVVMLGITITRPRRGPDRSPI